MPAHPVRWDALNEEDTEHQFWQDLGGDCRGATVQLSRLCTAAAPDLTELLTAVGWGVDELPPEFPSKNSHLSHAGLLLSSHSRARGLEFHLVSQNLLFLFLSPAL